MGTTIACCLCFVSSAEVIFVASTMMSNCAAWRSKAGHPGPLGSPEELQKHIKIQYSDSPLDEMFEVRADI